MPRPGSAPGPSSRATAVAARCRSTARPGHGRRNQPFNSTPTRPGRPVLKQIPCTCSSASLSVSEFRVVLAAAAHPGGCSVDARLTCRLGCPPPQQAAGPPRNGSSLSVIDEGSVPGVSTAQPAGAPGGYSSSTAPSVSVRSPGASRRQRACRGGHSPLYTPGTRRRCAGKGRDGTWSRSVDVVVIGMGPGGEHVAGTLAGPAWWWPGGGPARDGGNPVLGLHPVQDRSIRAADLIMEGTGSTGWRARRRRRSQAGRRWRAGSVTRRPTTGTTRRPLTGSPAREGSSSAGTGGSARPERSR